MIKIARVVIIIVIIAGIMAPFSFKEKIVHTLGMVVYSAIGLGGITLLDYIIKKQRKEKKIKILPIGKVVGGLFVKLKNKGNKRMLKSSKIIKIIGFIAMAIASIFFPFDLKGKIISFTFILVLGAMSLGTTNLVEYITNKFRENRNN
ncbi:hypothetical protein IIM_01198 [Bacillus cereus VD107]|nr:hypothetical protein IIM_01198 [Bacillus cereus VD107]